MAITARQLRFVEEILKGTDIGKAVTAAGGSKNPNSANTIGSRWLQVPEIAELVKTREAEEKARNAVTRQWVTDKLKTLAETASTDPARIRALELLGKDMGMFKDQIEHSGPDGKPLAVEMIRRIIVDPRNED